MVEDPYRILGVSPDATDAEIKRSFRKLARQHHPDRNPGDATSEGRFKEIEAAYDKIGTPGKRRKFDESNERERQERERQERERQEQKRQEQKRQERDIQELFERGRQVRIERERLERERLEEEKRERLERNRIAAHVRRKRMSEMYKMIEKEWRKRMKAKKRWLAIILVLFVPAVVISTELGGTICCAGLLYGLVIWENFATRDDWIKEKRIERMKKTSPRKKKKRVTHGWYDLLVKELYVFSGLFLIVVFLYAFGPDTWSWYEWGKIFPNSLGEKFFYGSCCIAPIIVLPFVLVYYAVRTS